MQRLGDMINYDLELELQIQIGSTVLPEYLVRSLSHAFYKLLKALESFDWHLGLQFVSELRTRAVTSHSKRLKRDTFPSKACNDFVILSM